jgi:hypothetical protein
MESALEDAIKLARERLAKLDIERQCYNCGVELQDTDSGKSIIIDFLNRSHTISLPDLDISLKDGNDSIPIKDKILILHYLAQAKGSPPTNKLVTIKELPDGRNYAPTFFKRAIKPILDNFQKDPQQLIETTKIFGGNKADYGDFAVTINPFKMVAITIVLWQGDEEFPPEASMMFDSNIPDYLSTYDIIELSETTAWRLVRNAIR